jgi:hypothetical protein
MSKFYYKDKVIVRQGFYKGVTGILIDQRIGNEFFPCEKMYLLENKKTKFKEWIFERNL